MARNHEDIGHGLLSFAPSISPQGEGACWPASWAAAATLRCLPASTSSMMEPRPQCLTKSGGSLRRHWWNIRPHGQSANTFTLEPRSANTVGSQAYLKWPKMTRNSKTRHSRFWRKLRNGALNTDSLPGEPRHPAIDSGAPLAAAAIQPNNQTYRQNAIYETIGIFNKPFRAAFSFPGEARDRIVPIVDLVRSALAPEGGFYDKWYAADFRRVPILICCSRVFTHARTLSSCASAPEYQHKTWCGIEWRAIQRHHQQTSRSDHVPSS